MLDVLMGATGAGSHVRMDAIPLHRFLPLGPIEVDYIYT
jgi:hypothetical protein